jgi:hypothetical protein
MSSTFEIGVNPAPEILGAPPPQFSDVPFIYCPVAVSMHGKDFPVSFWCDFAGVLLWRWFRQVWKLSHYETRCARLAFWYTYEIWLRRTRKHWWNVAFVERQPNDATITEEDLVIPERVEAALLTAIRRLLAGARRAGVWTEDCESLEQAMDDPEAYWTALEAGDINAPSFISGHLIRSPEFSPSIPGLELPAPAKRESHVCSPQANVVLPKPLAERRFAPMMVFCPRCTAVLTPSQANQGSYTCSLCGHQFSN